MGQAVKFTSRAIPGKIFQGSISFIDPVIDPAARVARVRVAVANPGLELKPGLFVNGTVDAGQTTGGDRLIIPQSAVLWTGTRSIVYVKLPDTETPAFKLREITLGASMKDSYIVTGGLQSGEEIVTNGTFSVDAAAQLAGKPSMMNLAGGAGSSPHDMSKMNMDGNSN
jgi:Cu(I)/Ag(I) efflux system membrane fusion protein